MGVAKITSRPGFNNRWHYHYCSHGMHVLDGILKTHAGSFGPGGFVWFPEGMEMEHGATQDNDVTFLVITTSHSSDCAMCRSYGADAKPRRQDGVAGLALAGQHDLCPQCQCLRRLKSLRGA